MITLEIHQFYLLVHCHSVLELPAEHTSFFFDRDVTFEPLYSHLIEINICSSILVGQKQLFTHLTSTCVLMQANGYPSTI
jgi:hypothetical protein